MKKSLLFIVLLLLSATSAYSDQELSVCLTNEHTKEQVNFDVCNVFVSMIDVDDDENAKVSVEIENRDDSNVLILFGHAYSEKQLKKLYSITYAKLFQGQKGKRTLSTYKDSRDDLIIEPSDKKKLPEISIVNGKAVCELPIYLAGYKKKSFWSFLGGSNGKNKIELYELKTCKLKIEVEVKDEDYNKLAKNSNDLIEEIEKKTFCPNRKHRPSLEKQEALYKDKIEKINQEINGIIARHHWKSSDKGYKKYDEIKQKLAAIDFSKYEQDCGRHSVPPPPVCKYCKLSAKDIYNKLVEYYESISNSTNQKARKNAVMTDVNLLYGCQKHSSVWKNSEWKDKITDRYNRINNL